MERQTWAFLVAIWSPLGGLYSCTSYAAAANADYHESYDNDGQNDDKDDHSCVHLVVHSKDFIFIIFAHIRVDSDLCEHHCCFSKTLVGIFG
jgi:hypothetical protein